MCENGMVSLTDPAFSSVRMEGKDFTKVSSDWKDRFVKAYDREFQLWVDSVKADELNGPNAWDGYVAAITSTACSKARDTGERVQIQLDECPDLYKNSLVLA